MSGRNTSRPATYFEELYAANPDPWNFASSDYEKTKYAATIAALEDRNFHNVFEIGCSIGILTKLLSARCRSLLAIDLVETALADARKYCAGLPHVRFENFSVPYVWPSDRSFDLIICSEVLYFLSPRDIARVAHLATGSILPGGWILLVNFTGPIDEPCSGDDAAKIFIDACRGALVLRKCVRAESFRIDLLERQSQPIPR